VIENPEEDSFTYTATRDGFQSTCFVNGITILFEFNKAEKEVYISPAATMKLLKDGSIDKTDFKGDVNKILGTGTVTDKAVLTIKELKIGRNVVKNLDVTVNSKAKQDIIFGDNTLQKFGAYTIDDKDNKVIFNK
jgi:ABC-type uncharacterized transport system YnjBCD substrate-binding protein